MKPIEQQTLANRIIATFVIVVVIILILAFIGWISGWDEAPAAVQVPIDPRHERKFIDMDRNAIEAAYHDQIMHLFEVWMKDDTGQPARAVKGAKQARKAFADSMDAIDERERQLNQGIK